MKLSDKLIKLRKEKGLSQEELGNEINISRQAISKWESEATKPDVDRIIILAKFYNVSCDYLLDDEVDEYEKEIEKNVEDNIKEEKIVNRIIKSNFFKFILGLFILYLVICFYKFIILMRFHLIGKSFSEENYSMVLGLYDYSNRPHTANMRFDYLVIGDELLFKTYVESEELINYNNSSYPNRIEYVDYKDKVGYNLDWNGNIKKYEYTKLENNNEEKVNLIRESAIGNDSLITILYSAFNPFVYYVSPFTNTVITYYPSEQTTHKVTYTGDGLISYILNVSKDGTIIKWNYSYDYVQEHFNDKIIINPLDDESYKELISYR